MSTRNKTFQIRVCPEDVEDLRAVARELDVPMAEVIRRAVYELRQSLRRNSALATAARKRAVGT